MAEMARLRPDAFAALGGALAASGQAPFDLAPLALAGWAVLARLVWTAPGPRAAARAGWAFGAAHFLVALHWIVEPFLVDAARHAWMAPFALILLAGGLALFWGAAAGLARRLSDRPAVTALALAGAVTLAEWVRGWIFTGFPWASAGHVWIDTAALPVAAVTGAPGLTLATVAAAGLAAAGFAGRSALAAPFTAAAAAALILWVAPPPAPAAAGPRDGGPVIRLIQPNAPQRAKWDPEHLLTFYQRQLDFTAAPGGPDLIVWPETAIPWSGDYAADAFAQIAATADGVPVMVGWQRREGADVFNSLALIGPDGTAIAGYDKHHLVPFGEYVPLAPLADRLNLRGLAVTALSGFTPGPGPAVLDAAGLKALPLICYELIFPRNLRNAPVRPDLILHLTNDAWFGRTSGPQQHLAQARLRAAEFGLPVLRAANTGISAVIDATGRVVAQVPLGEAGYLDAAVPPAAAPTFYARFGDSPALGAALVLLALGWATGRRKSD